MDIMSNRPTNTLTKEPHNEAVQSTIDEAKYRNLSKAERKKIDAQRHSQGLEKYRDPFEPQPHIVSPAVYKDMEAKGYVKDGVLTRAGQRYLWG